MPSLQRVKDLIYQIRSCKTAATERELVNKECAKIREGFSNHDNDNRYLYLAKLLYIYMLGYPAHFGHMECLTLISSANFTDKKIGYLGASLLLDERQDVHLLITNSIKKDFEHSSQYVVGLALTTLGCILSAEMGRDLANEVEKLFHHKHSYVRKKAALCAVRIVSKDPDLAENFVPSLKRLLSDRNHGVVLGGVSLGYIITQQFSEGMQEMRAFVPHLVKLLRTLLNSSHAPDHDVQGVTDPFLQVYILRWLRLLGKDNDCTESMNDILAQVATNTDSGRNVGHAVLYETVRTIMDIQAEKGLRVLAINILGRFLLNTDKNIRYVALNTLMKSVYTADSNAIQRHRATVVDCLKDPDISIRKRAIELCFSLMNKENVESLLGEILKFLETAQDELKAYIMTNIFTPIERYAPSRIWHTSTLLNLLKVAGSYIRDDQVYSIIQLFAAHNAMHNKIALELYLMLQDDVSQQPQVQIAVWCIGEFSEKLLKTPGDIKADETNLIAILQLILESSLSLPMTQVYTLNSLMKLSTRVKSKGSVEKIKLIFSKYKSNSDPELQQRSVEYEMLFDKYDHMRKHLLDQIPLRSNTSAESSDEQTVDESTIELPPRGTAQNSSRLQPSADTLIDVITQESSTRTPASNSELLSNGLSYSSDLLSLITGTASVADSANQATDNTTTNVSTGTPVNGGLGELESLMFTAGTVDSTIATSYISSITPYDKNGVKIIFNFEKNLSAPGTFKLSMSAINSNAYVISDFLFQAAVPKSFSIQMHPPSSNMIAPGGSVLQPMFIANPSNSPIKMLVKLSYNAGGSLTNDQLQVSNFPSELTAQ